MKTLLLRLEPNDKITFFGIIFIFAFSLFNTIAYKRINPDVRKIISFFPLIFSIVHIFIFHYKGYEALTFLLYGIMYISTILIAVWPFVSAKANLSMMIITNVICIVSIVYFLIVPAIIKPHIGNYTHCNYVETFEKTVDKMKEDYILGDWKEIDFDGLKNKLMPMVEKAEQDKDEVLYCEALLRYVYYMYDGHISLNPLNRNGRKAMEKVKERLAGNDYGFSLTRLDDGKTIAILVEEDSEAAKNGIQFGTVITKWNGIAVDEALKEIECVYPEIKTFPVAANEEYVKPFFLAGKGGDTCNVAYIDEAGIEREISLNKIGNNIERLEDAIALFYHREGREFDNLFSYRCTEDCGYIRIKSEMMSFTESTTAQIFGEYKLIVKRITDAIKSIGPVDRIILDLRNNSGGYDLFSVAVASVFTDEVRFAYSDGKWVDGVFETVDRHELKGTGQFKNLQVSVLVNAECRSAADSMTEMLSKLPNVTIYGITGNNCIDQNPGGMCVTTNGEFMIAYPIGPVLDENNLPRIDTKADRLATVEMDHHIELNLDAAYSIFEKKIDYELDYVMTH